MSKYYGRGGAISNPVTDRNSNLQSVRGERVLDLLKPLSLRKQRELLVYCLGLWASNQGNRHLFFNPSQKENFNLFQKRFFLAPSNIEIVEGGGERHEKYRTNNPNVVERAKTLASNGTSEN